MSWIGHTRLLSRCSACLAGVSIGPSRLVIARQSIRNAGTASATKTRATKTATVTADELLTISKKNLSTKSTPSTPAAPAKSPRKKKADTAAAGAGENAIGNVAPTIVKKTTRAASKNSGAAKSGASTTTKRKKADEKADAGSLGTKPSPAAYKPAPAPTRFAQATKSTAAEAKPVVPSVPKPSPVPPVQPTPTAVPKATPKPSSTARVGVPYVDVPLPRRASVGPIRARTPEIPARPKVVDQSSPEYKDASRKWVSIIIALPILLVTSYYLFDRLALGNNPTGVSPLTGAPSLEESTSGSDSSAASKSA